MRSDKGFVRYLLHQLAEQHWDSAAKVDLLQLRRGLLPSGLFADIDICRRSNRTDADVLSRYSRNVFSI